MTRFEKEEIFKADLEQGYPLGDVLRGERATRGKSLEDVQNELRIKAHFIEGIENLDVSVFESASFVSGYVRSYAAYLGLSPDEVFRRFCDEAGFEPPMKLETAAAKVRKTGSGFSNAAFAGHSTIVKEEWWERVSPAAIGSIAVLLLILGGLGFMGYRVLVEVQKVRISPTAVAPVIADAGPELISDPADNGNIETASASPADVPANLSDFYRPQLLDTPILVPRDGPISQIKPQLEQITALPEAVNVEAETQDAVPQVTEVAATGVEIFAVQPAWISVSSPSLGTLFERILDANTRYRVPADVADALLRAGNSGSVYVIVDGEAYGPVGERTRVAKNVVLNSDSIRDVYEPVDALTGYDPSATPVNLAQTQ